MSTSGPAVAAAISAWTAAPNWRTLLRLNARYVREFDDTAPYPLPCNLRITKAVQSEALELQVYGFLVRYARLEWDSGPVWDNSTIPNGGPWGRTQDRAFLHLVLPTEAGIPKIFIQDLLLKLRADTENLEVTMLADWKDYPSAGQQTYPHHARSAQPEHPSIEPQARSLEMFHSTLSSNVGDLLPLKITGRTFGRSRFAATKDGLKAKTVPWRRCAVMPYDTVDNVPAHSKDCRALGMQIKAVQDAKVLEIVVASKKFRTGEGDEQLDLVNYVMVMCDTAGIERDFEDCA